MGDTTAAFWRAIQVLLESYSSGKEVGKACSRWVVHNQVHRAIRRNKYEGVIAKGLNEQGDFNRMVNNLNALGVLHASIAFAPQMSLPP